MDTACPACGSVVDVAAEKQEICPHCYRPVFGEGFDPNRYYGPKLGAALGRLRLPNHWDYLLGGWLMILAIAGWVTAMGWVPDNPLNIFREILSASPTLLSAAYWGILWWFTSIIPIPEILLFLGGYRITRVKDRGMWPSLSGASICVAFTAIGWMYVLIESQGQEIGIISTICLALSAGTLGALIYYWRHPLNRYRYGTIDKEKLERLLGDYRFNLLMYRLAVEAGDDQADSDVR
jgi:hypothetical protein